MTTMRANSVDKAKTTITRIQNSVAFFFPEKYFEEPASLWDGVKDCISIVIYFPPETFREYNFNEHLFERIRQWQFYDKWLLYDWRIGYRKAENKIALWLTFKRGA